MTQATTRAGLKKTDAQIQQAVREEFAWDTRVKPADIGVEVHNGIVALNGHVESWAARVAAQEAAHRVSGVYDVVNDIVVKLPGSLQRDDTDLAQAVRRALDSDVQVAGAKIQTTVANGVVTLEGTVDCFAQREDAGRCIRNLAGVVSVKNLIVLEPPLVALHDLRSSIEQALERQADRIASHVHVAVSGSAVTVKGSVPSARERRIVEEAIRRTSGVKTVDNQLTLPQLMLS